MNFDLAFDRLMKNEGGYSNNPADPGGETNWGVTIRIARAHGYTGLMKDMTREQARPIYLEAFWQDGKMDQFDGALAFQAFDAAVNHGIPNAIRMVQKAADVADDGHIGPVTIAAVKAKTVTDMLMLFIAERIDFWTRLSTWNEFGKGWARRAATDLRFAAQDS